MKRSTLIYYLEILETRKIIKRKRIETKETGRPTKIIFSKEGYKRWEDKILHEDIGGLKTFVLHIIEVINNGVKLGRIKKNDYEDFKKKVISSFN